MKKAPKNSCIYLAMILSTLVACPQAFCTDATPSSMPTSSTPALSSAAIGACADKEKGDACDFTNEKGESLNGRCGYSGSDQKLACIAYQ